MDVTLDELGASIDFTGPDVYFVFPGFTLDFHATVEYNSASGMAAAARKVPIFEATKILKAAATMVSDIAVK